MSFSFMDEPLRRLDGSPAQPSDVIVWDENGQQYAAQPVLDDDEPVRMKTKRDLADHCRVISEDCIGRGIRDDDQLFIDIGEHLRLVAEYLDVRD